MVKLCTYLHHHHQVLEATIQKFNFKYYFSRGGPRHHFLDSSERALNEHVLHTNGAVYGVADFDARTDMCYADDFLSDWILVCVCVSLVYVRQRFSSGERCRFWRA